MSIRTRLQKLAPIDYLVLFGGPILFLLVAWFGLMAVIGPAPRPNPVELLRHDTVSIGMPVDQVVAKLGPPTSIEQKISGGQIYHYVRTALEAGNVSSDEGLVEFGDDNRVTAIRFDRSAPPAPPIAR